MSEKENDNVRNINSGRPFGRAAQEYFNKGWTPIPIPYKEKHPPEKGYTGRQAQEVDQDKLNSWLGRGRDGRIKCNVGLHMRTVEVDGEEFYVIGIDVDNYSSGGKEKHGAAQLEQLEVDLCRLPPTYISTSREDGYSGIRFYRVPVPPDGYSFRDKVAKDIEMLQSSHRYAMVWPSLHPEGREYRWTSSTGIPGHRVGTEISFDTHEEYDRIGEHGIPDARELPILPKEWIEYLTQGYMPYSETDIDMNTEPPEMRAWAEKTFAPGKMCKKMRDKVEYWKKMIDEDATSHDKVRDAHWNILRVASPLEQGHTGWLEARKQLEKHWMASVIKPGKRSVDEASIEIWRSYMNAYRKIKAEMDNAAEDGKVLVPGKVCQCSQGLKAGEKGPEEYDRDDDGNAQFLVDLNPGRLVWVAGFRTWIYWNDKRWIRDSDGLARRRFVKVKKRQAKYAKKLVGDAAVVVSADKESQEAKQAVRDAKEWRDWAKRSGMMRPVEDALKVATSLKGVTVAVNSWDNEERLLGVKGGILELRPDSVYVRPARKEDFVTLSTGTAYRGYAEFEGTPEFELWNEYLDTFFPVKNKKGEELRRFLQKVLGYCLLSGNPERLTLFFRGQSGGGKSTMLTAIKAAMGDYADTVSSGIFGGKFENPEMVQALPKRIITLSEIDNHDKLDKSVFKRMCGGDVISCRELYANEVVKRIPGFVVIIATNSNPTVTGADDALLRRLCVIPFETYVTKEEEKATFSDDIRQRCGEVILSWLVEGYKMYAKEGLKYETWPAIVRGTTEEFGSSLDEVGEFLAECTERQEGAHTNTSDLYNAYKSWCNRQGIPEIRRMTANALGRQMTSKGWTKSRKRMNNSNAWKYLDLKLTEPGVKLKIRH